MSVSEDPVRGTYYVQCWYKDWTGKRCRRLVAERVYDRTFYAVCNPETLTLDEPAADMTWAKFEAALKGKVSEALA